ncbi:hypothetical protein [[Haemophilus] ducreyi]|uniref:hypothetical protein n=1 Tax=Haemophilus ducreyi TaxID=730 RepID=UPI000AD067D4|nr:hypothetical protein [[Haemophilus] ducreyi]
MFTTQLAAIVSVVALLGGWGVFKSVQVSREKKKNQALLQKNTVKVKFILQNVYQTGKLAHFAGSVMYQS